MRQAIVSLGLFDRPNFLCLKRHLGAVIMKHSTLIRNKESIIYYHNGGGGSWNLGEHKILGNKKGRAQNFFLLTLSGPGGAQRPGWPNSQLPIRNLLSYDAQTWWLLVFILETPFGHILAKLVNQGGCCCSFLIETSQKFWKWKIFPMLENCWNWHGGSILGREERFWT